MTGIKQQCFGVEIELTGITRQQAAEALARYFGTSVQACGGTYDTYAVQDQAGREWKLMRDGSIAAEKKTSGGYRPISSGAYQVEFVTPKLGYEDMPVFQECIRQIRHAGGKVNESCGLHVHVDGAGHNRQSLKNLLSIMFSKEDMLFKALQVNEGGRSDGARRSGNPC